MIRLRNAAGHALLAALCLLATPAAGQDDENDGAAEASDHGPTPQQRALAEALFREGKQLGEEGQIARACKKFKESQRLDPAIGTLLHLAACYAEEGKTASAWAAFNSAADLAQRAKQKDREALARARATELEQQLSRLVIAIAEPAVGQTIELDGQPLGEETLATPLPIDPGAHELSVAAPGKRAWQRQFEIEAGPTTQTIEVPVLEEAPDEPASEPERPPPPPPPAPPAAGPGWQRSAGFIAGGAGLLGIGIGSYFGLRAASQADDADQYCQGRTCSQPGIDGHEQARSSALIANVAFGVGIAALASGTVLLLISGPASDPAAGARRPSQAGLWLGAGFGQVTTGARW